MTAAHAAPAALACIILGLGIGMTLIGRGWPDRRKHRGPRAPRRIEVEVRGRDLIPALAGPGWPATASRYCIGCRTDVPVTIHDTAHSCERGHITIHTTTGSTL